MNAFLVQRLVVSGTIATAATFLATALCGRRRGAALAPINATSHVLWGEAAGRQERASLRYTVPGTALNAGASLLWAAIYERLFGASESRAMRALGGPAVSALAYVTDYHLVPKRLTPGWELRLKPADLALVYLALAAVLPLRALFARR